jgi:hypothetical protein
VSTHDLDQLSRRLPPPSRVDRQTARIQRLADWLHSDTLDELRRIAGESPTPLEEGPGLGHHEGYGPGGQNGPRGSDVSDPTYTRATAKHQPDPTGDAIADLFAAIERAANEAVTIDRLAGYVAAARAEQGKRPVSLAGDCGACGRPVAGTSVDKLVSGFCGACRKAWERAGYPDRSEFAATRRRALNDNDGTAA